MLDLNRTREQSTPAWTTTDRTIGGYVHWDGNESTTGNRGRLFSWSDTIGKLFEESTGTTADGSDLVTDYEGPAFITGLPMARFLELYGEFQPTAGTFALEVLVDACLSGLAVGEHRRGPLAVRHEHLRHGGLCRGGPEAVPEDVAAGG
jgi:hypothetical protein